MTVETDELVLDLAARHAAGDLTTTALGVTAELDPLEVALAQLLGDGVAALAEAPAAMPSAALADVLAGRVPVAAPHWAARIASAVAGLGLAAKLALGAGVAVAALGVAHHEHLLPAPLQHLLGGTSDRTSDHRPAPANEPDDGPRLVDSTDPTTGGAGPEHRARATPSGHSGGPAPTTGRGGPTTGEDDASSSPRGSTGSGHDDSSESGTGDGPRTGSTHPRPSESAEPRDDSGDDDDASGGSTSEAPEPSDSADPSDGTDGSADDGTGDGTELPGVDDGPDALPGV